MREHPPLSQRKWLHYDLQFGLILVHVKAYKRKSGYCAVAARQAGASGETVLESACRAAFSFQSRSSVSLP
jgi:hypothetical protein